MSIGIKLSTAIKKFKLLLEWFLYSEDFLKITSEKVCIVVRMADEQKAATFMEDRKEDILKSGHILETTERSVYLG